MHQICTTRKENSNDMPFLFARWMHRKASRPYRIILFDNNHPDSYKIMCIQNYSITVDIQRKSPNIKHRRRLYYVFYVSGCFKHRYSQPKIRSPERNRRKRFIWLGLEISFTLDRPARLLLVYLMRY